MLSTRTRRILGAGTATIVAALAAGTAAVPAHAAGTQLRIFPTGTIQISTQPAPQPQFGENIHLRIGRSGTDVVTGAKLAFDTTGIDGLATLSVPGCATAGKVITCDIWRLDLENINITSHPWLSAVAGVRPGSTGTVHATLSAPGAETAEADIQVEIGGAGFRTKEPSEQRDVKVGSTLPSTLAFANHGEVAARRAVVEVYLTPGLDVATWPSNCEYAKDKGDWAGHGFGSPMPTVHGICTIDGEIAPGQAVKLNGLDLTVGADARYAFADYAVFPDEGASGSSAADLRRRMSFQRGTGAPAVLVPTSGEGIPDGLDMNAYSTEQEVLADNYADFAVNGSWAPDASGTTGTFTLGAVSGGPASIMDRSGGESAPELQVQFPEGVTVTGLPSTCQPYDYVLGQKSDKPLNKFNCEGLGGFFIPAGATNSHKLTLSVPAGTDELTATVSLQNMASSYEPGHPSAVMSWDRNPANDLLKVALRATPATTPGTGGTPAPTPTGTPTTAPVTDPSPAPTTAVVPAGLSDKDSASPVRETGTGTGGTGGTGTGGSGSVRASDGPLAATGSSAALPLAATSAAAVVLGAAGLVTARRLRTRRNG
ncbi:hypothetical protein ACFVUY_03160 [Kitasatospora sp. NPDC058063]|uniref:hypothetical protein n=1 Tax=unclassified Kitasatospora TaxID=2633591 RepID=UPI0036D81F62